MVNEGFNSSFDINLDCLPDNEFHTSRKTKVFHEDIFFRWNPLNFINKQSKRKTDDAYESVSSIKPFK